jgi:hypothetical protein
VLDRFEIAFDGAPHAYSPVPETRIRRAEARVARPWLQPQPTIDRENRAVDVAAGIGAK